jgi:hypothetical protein
MVFTVDGLETAVNLVIANPQPKVFVLSGQTINTATGGTTPKAYPVSTPIDDADTDLTDAVDTVDTNNNDYKFSTTGEDFELLKYFDNGASFGTLANMINKDNHVVDIADKFAELVDGVYTIELPSTYTSAGTFSADGTKNGLYANVAVADLAIGVYNYKIVKTYPDGRVVTIQDTAEVTELDANQIAVFGTSTKANNTKFNDNWRIAEISSEFEKGTYTFEFSIGTATRTYTVNIIDRPILVVSSISIGGDEAVLFDSKYSLKAINYSTATKAVVLNYTLRDLTTADYVSVAVNKTDANTSATFAFATAYVSNAKVLLGASSINIGTLSGNLEANDKIAITFTFWKKVDHSVAAGRYVQIGETQVVTVGYIAPLA